MKTNIPMGLFLSLMLAFPAVAAQKPLPVGDLEVSADSLGPVVLGKSIECMMRDGTYVAGKVIRSGRGEIAVDVRKSEPKGRIRGDQVVIPTAEISVVYMKKGGTPAAPIALGVVCGIFGFIGGSYIGYVMDDVTATVIFSIGSAAGAATAGAMIGREIVKKKVTIVVNAPAK